MILPQVLYALLCIGFAYVNYWLIEKKNARIYHGLNGAIHLLLIGICGYIYGLWIAMVMLFIGRLFFDVALNLIRGKAIDYVSPRPKSIVDRVEKRIFGNNGLLPKLIYLAAIITLNIL